MNSENPPAQDTETKQGASAASSGATGTSAGDAKLKWCEFGDRPSTERFTAVSEALARVGLANEWSFVQFEEGENAMAAVEKFEHVRLTGRACTAVLKGSLQVPSETLTVGAADALVTDPDGSRWPRCFFSDAISRTMAKLQLDLDFNGGVFVLGATPEARWVINALSRIGFSRVSLSDPNEATGQTFVDEMRRTNFGVQIQNVPRHLLTQLPGVHPIGVNTLAKGPDEGALDELFYFNFLKPGGTWLDLALVPYNSALETEAKSVGAQIVPGHQVLALTDSLWASSTFGVQLDLDALIADLVAKTGR